MHEPRVQSLEQQDFHSYWVHDPKGRVNLEDHRARRLLGLEVLGHDPKPQALVATPTSSKPLQPSGLSAENRRRPQGTKHVSCGGGGGGLDHCESTTYFEVQGTYHPSLLTVLISPPESPK